MNPKKLVVHIVIILSIVFYIYIVPHGEDEEANSWKPKNREIIKLELNNNEWSYPTKAPAGHCTLYERPTGQKITVQYQENPDSDWEFYSDPDGWIPPNASRVRFRAVYSYGFIFYETRPGGQCSRGIMKGVGDSIWIKIVLPKNTWSHEVDVLKDMCIKWQTERGKQFSVQFKQGKYDNWKSWPNPKEYLAWKTTLAFRWKSTIAGGYIKYSQRPLGQCKD